MIKYLTDEEKNITRNIWEKIFLEDSKSFLDYYYKVKTADNKILCKYIDNEIVSMLHLNPYSMSINKKTCNSYYIVAVATLEEHRKKGYMAQLLNKSINDMYDENIPFCFLKPAKKEIYLPFGFEYIYNHDTLELDNDSSFIYEPISYNDYLLFADFTNQLLSKKYNVFCKRSPIYMYALSEEVKSENGDIVKILKDNMPIGYYVYWGISKKITRAIFINDKYTSIKETKPLVMGRIVNIYEFFKNFTLKDSSYESLSLHFSIKDDIIVKNNGFFKLNISNYGSSIEKITECNEKNLLYIDIKNLLSIFFGYKNISLFTDNNYIIDNFDKIKLLNNVYIDEEV